MKVHLGNSAVGAMYALLIALLTMITTPVAAQLILCNETGENRAFAIAQKVNDDWQSEGWWTIETGACKTVEGDALTQRYYYYLATKNSKATHDGDYAFCTQPQAFEIRGQGDCAARGYDTAHFDVIDTGTSAKKFTFTLNAAKKKGNGAAPAKINETPASETGPASTPAMTLGPTFEDDPFTPGSLGEPYTVIGVFQGCDIIDGWDHCAYHAEGWKHFAGRGEGTPDHYLDALENVPRGTRLQFIGDLKSYGDITTDVAIRQIRPVPKGPHDAIIAAVQGYWESNEDSSTYFEIIGSERREYYDGNLIGEEYLSWHSGCQHIAPDNQSTFMIATNPENRDEPLCYYIVSVGQNHLTLSYVGGTGQDLNYTRQQN